MRNVFLALGVLGLTAVLNANELPSWAFPLREAVYDQTLDAASVAKLGAEIEDRARKELAGCELLVMLSRCEYFIAQVFSFYKMNSEALEHYQLGFDYADSAAKEAPSSDAWEMMSKNLSGLCTVKSKGWVMLNGTKVESYARKGLELDPKNAACQYQIAARWVYAPAPFNNTRKGIQMMREILFGKYNLQKDDRFNVLISIAFGYDRSKQHDEALSWAEKALEIYPENEDARNLTQGKSRVEFTD